MAITTGATRGKLVSQPRSGAKPLGNSEPGTIPPARRQTRASNAHPQSRSITAQTRTVERQTGIKPPKKRGSQRRSKSRTRRDGFARPNTRGFTVPPIGKASGNDVGVLVGTYILAMLIIGFTVFSDTAAGEDVSTLDFTTTPSMDYLARILSIFKRGAAVSALWFILALFAAGGGYAAKGAKWFSVLVILGMAFNAVNHGQLTAFNNFFSADWTGLNVASKEAGKDKSKEEKQSESSKILNDLKGALNFVKGLAHGFPGFPFPLP